MLTSDVSLFILFIVLVILLATVLAIVIDLYYKWKLDNISKEIELKEPTTTQNTVRFQLISWRYFFDLANEKTIQLEIKNLNTNETNEVISDTSGFYYWPSAKQLTDHSLLEASKIFRRKISWGLADTFYNENEVNEE